MCGSADTPSATATSTPASLSWPASVKPPPNNSKMSHGRRWVSRHESNVSSGRPEGITNNIAPAAIAMVVSLSGIPHWVTNQRRATQHKAVAPNTTATRFSAKLHAPREASSSFNSCTPPSNGSTDTRQSTRVSKTYTKPSITAENGNAMTIHSRKGTVWPTCSSTNPAMATLGGVPTSVAMPPRLAA